MSPQGIGITTTYKTRVALEKPCKRHYGIDIGQLEDRHPNASTCFWKKSIACIRL